MLMPNYVIVDANKLDNFEHMVADYLEDTPDLTEGILTRKETIRECITLLDKDKSTVTREDVEDYIYSLVDPDVVFGGFDENLELIFKLIHVINYSDDAVNTIRCFIEGSSHIRIKKKNRKKAKYIISHYKELRSEE